jgi:cytochrome o ubiquinol oxidase subunit 2
MTSFWIPELGGQMYAMPGMKTILHLMATNSGEYSGYTAEINGRGFAGMKFVAKASSQNDFDNWLKTTMVTPDITFIIKL